MPLAQIHPTCLRSSVTGEGADQFTHHLRPKNKPGQLISLNVLLLGHQHEELSFTLLSSAKEFVRLFSSSN